MITHLKSNFARYGIPDTVVSDNGPQYSAADFSNFAMHYGFTHVTSSPKYPQANGEAERAVRTEKNLLKKSDDPYLAMLAYRSTPLENGYSPAELLMGRRLRTMIPTIAKQLAPKLPKGSKLQGKEGRMRQRQKNNFDQHHRAKELQPLAKGDKVWIPDNKSWGTVQEETQTRSYVVASDSGGTYQRNRSHLVQLLPPDEVVPDAQTPQSTEMSAEQPRSPFTPTIRSPESSIPTQPNTPGSKTRQGTKYK